MCYDQSWWLPLTQALTQSLWVNVLIISCRLPPLLSDLALSSLRLLFQGPGFLFVFLAFLFCLIIATPTPHLQLAVLFFKSLSNLSAWTVASAVMHPKPQSPHLPFLPVFQTFLSSVLAVISGQAYCPLIGRWPSCNHLEAVLALC